MKHWTETRAVLERLAELERAGTKRALATVVAVRGSAYRHEGAKLLVAADGGSTGNVSGGCLESDVREVAARVIRSGRAELRTYCSSSDEIAAWDLGVGCDGRVDVFVEPAPAARPAEQRLLDDRRPFVACSLLEPGAVGRLVVTADGTQGSLGDAALDRLAAAAALDARASRVRELGGRPVFFDAFEPPPRLVLFGAGDDAQALARVGAEVGFDVTVVDHRAAFLRRDRFPAPARRLEARPEDYASGVSLDASCFVVAMNHNFALDQAAAGFALGSPVRYVGMLGPRARTERILGNLGREGRFTDRDQGRIYGPAGLDVGTDGAEQVAVAIVSELLAVHSGREARSLRERAAPIHAG